MYKPQHSSKSSMVLMDEPSLLKELDFEVTPNMLNERKENSAVEESLCMEQGEPSFEVSLGLKPHHVHTCTEKMLPNQFSTQ